MNFGVDFFAMVHELWHGEDMSSTSADWHTLLEASLETILGSASEGFLIFDLGGTCRAVGRQVGELFGVDTGQLIGKAYTEVVVALSEKCEEAEEFLSMVGSFDRDAPSSVLGEVEVRSPKRILVWSSIRIEQAGEVIGRLEKMKDITRETSCERTRRHLLARIEKLTPFDALTGLANRRRFAEEHEREHARALRAWDTYALLRMDVDGMGDINDQFGVPVGDSVLERLAEMLESDRRDYDVVARLGNDEFAILLPGADRVAATAVAERIRASLESASDSNGDGPQVSFCVGVAVCSPPTAETAQDIMRRAGEALLTAKEKGRAVIVVDAPNDESDESGK